MSEHDGTTVPPPASVTHRLFFAVWPAPGVRDSLAASVSRLPPGSGRLQRPDQWHMTLEFLGAVPEERLGRVLEAGAAAAAAGTPCEVIFDAVEYWRRPQVLCLTARETPGELSGLVRLLREELRARGFEAERREFRAHLTLARKVSRPPAELSLRPLHWPVVDLALVESITDRSGARYEQRAAWPVAG